jgi:hypothetical protein
MSANILLKHGWHVNYADNGPGGYGFDVTASIDMLVMIKQHEESSRSAQTGGDPFFDGSWTVVTTELPSETLQKMADEVSSSAWTGHCNYDGMIAEWRRWFILLPPRVSMTATTKPSKSQKKDDSELVEYWKSNFIGVLNDWNHMNDEACYGWNKDFGYLIDNSENSEENE